MIFYIGVKSVMLGEIIPLMDIITFFSIVILHFEKQNIFLNVHVILKIKLQNDHCARLRVGKNRQHK